MGVNEHREDSAMKKAMFVVSTALLSFQTAAQSAVKSANADTTAVLALNQHHQQVQLQIQQQQLDNELAQLQLQHAQLMQNLRELNDKSSVKAATVTRPHHLISEVRFADLRLRRYEVNQQPHWHRDKVDTVENSHD